MGYRRHGEGALHRRSMGSGVSDQQHRFALEFLERLPLDEFNSIIDIGAGPGYQTDWLLRQGKMAMAVDLCSPLCDVPYTKADAENLPFPDDSLDAAWTHHAFEHMFNPLRALCEVSRVLRPHGWLFLTVPQIDGTISSGHIVSYDMALVVYHLAICGFDTRQGYFKKERSHLRAAVRKIDTPVWPTLDTSVRSLQRRGRLPKSCDAIARDTGRFNTQSVMLNSRWLPAPVHQ